MDMLGEAKRQSTLGGTKKAIGLGSIENPLRCGRLCWYGHVQRLDPDTWLGRWTRQLLLVITLGAAPGRHGYMYKKGCSS